MKALIGVIALVLLSGCAAVFQGQEQEVKVTAVDAIATTRCKASNNKGEYYVTNGVVTVKRSTKPLDIVCENRRQLKRVSVESKADLIYILPNLALDYCTLSCVMDYGTRQTGYSYPKEVELLMDFR